MAQPVPLRPDYDAPALLALARRSNDAAKSRRLLALAAIYNGASSEAARLGGGTPGVRPSKTRQGSRMRSLC